MTSQFYKFADAVSAQINKMHGLPWFRVDVLDLNETYLNAFPEGTNPIFRTNTEHDCNTDRHFLRRMGTVVALREDGTRMTCFDDLGELPEPYATVAMALRETVRQAPIIRAFYTSESQFGQKTSPDTHSDIIWNHFYGKVCRKVQSTMPDKSTGIQTAAHQVFSRGLRELTQEALDTVVSLIEEERLYRGAEHMHSINKFLELRRAWQKSPDPEGFAWANAYRPASRFRNSVIGTLIIDLSNGKDLEEAVRMFESKVAPANYKRPKALITPKMVEQATAQLEELGLMGSVKRRHATFADVSVNDVLFVDNEIKPQMADAWMDELNNEAKRQSASDPKALLERATPIPVADFIDQIVPQAASLELFLDNKMMGNFASITAPEECDSGKLFKWGNDFAWSYDGDVADSIAQQVKAAGGKIDVPLRVSLSWNRCDDLDIHANCPEGHVYYSNRRGILDVDMNVGGGREPKDVVENLAWKNPHNGHYEIKVHNFTHVARGEDGYTIELACNGSLEQFHCPKVPRSKAKDSCIEFDYRNGQVVNLKVNGRMTGGSVSSEKWGVNTMQLVPIDVLLRSPNHWEGAGTGNLHWFFILRDCLNPNPVRGIYNEYLRPELDQHRKVFEVLGSKTKCPYSDKQLSGVGFSSTKRDEALVVVDGKRAFQLQF